MAGKEVLITEDASDISELKRNGHIPGWDEVASRFGLQIDELSPGEKKLLQDFYRGHRRLAQGEQKRGRRVLNGLDKNPHFNDLEEAHGSLLTLIVDEVNGARVQRLSSKRR